MGFFTSRRQPNRILAARPDDPPVSPSAYDDEFDGPTLDPKWTVNGTLDDVNPIHPFAVVAGKHRYSFSHRTSWLMIQSLINNELNFQQAVTLPTNCFWMARMSFSQRWNAVSNNDTTVGIQLLADSGGAPDTANLVFSYLNESDANTVQHEAGKAVAGVTTSSITRNVGPQSVGTDTNIQDACFIAIQKLGSTYNFGLGQYHGNWLWMTPQTIAFTPAWLRVRFFNVSNSTPGTMIMGIDFIRMFEGKGLP